MSNGRTFENNGRQIREELIDPGPIPDLRVLRQEEKAIRHALGRSTPRYPMRRDKP